MSRIRADQLINRAGSGGPKFPNGIADGFSVSGIVTATSYRGDGSQLTGIDASSLKDGSSNVKVQAVSGGANVTGNVAATGNITAVNATFSGDLTVNGTTTTIDTAVTSVDSLSLDGNITIGSTVHAPDFTGGGAAKAITIGTIGDALLVTHSSGRGLGYFGYESDGDRLVIACDGGSGSNKIDFITDAGTTSGDSTNNLNGKVPKMRITAAGNVGIGTDSPSASHNLTVSGSNDTTFTNNPSNIFVAGINTSGSGTAGGGINFGGRYRDDNGNTTAFAVVSGIKENTTHNNWAGALTFATRENGNAGGNQERLRITSDGHILPGTDNTQDLGSSSKRFANIYTGDLNLSNEGSANDVDGTWGQYTIQEGEDDLFLINRRTGKKYKFNLTEVN